MRKENEFGGVYHQMNFTADDLEEILDALSDSIYDLEVSHPSYIALSNIIDRIEKELGIG